MSSKKTRVNASQTLDESAIELAILLTEVVHAAKRRSGAPAPELAAAAERVGLSLATTSLLVGELSRAGILTRSEDERDRRRTIVTISEEYEDWVSTWVAQVVEPMHRALERLSPRARADFMRGLRILSEESASFAAEAEDAVQV